MINFGMITNRKIFLPILFSIILFCSFLLNEKPNINIVFIGDSITHGIGPKDQSPPIFAENYLQQLNRFGTVHTSNQGVSGFTTVDFLPATHKAYQKVKNAAAQFYQDKQANLIFSIMLGTNDSAIKGPNGSPVSPAAYHQNLKTITDSLLAAFPDCKIVYNYPIWYSTNTHNSGATYLQEGLFRLQSYYPEMDNLVKAYQKSNPKHVFIGDKKGFKFFQKNYLNNLKPEKGPDGTFYLHPNRDGDIALGNFWGKAISHIALK
jgi:lysophospholipase L1-like esterase